MELTIDQVLQQGVTAHNAGNLQEAERLYLAILKTQPAHSDANHNLGVIAVALNNTESALPLFKKALETNPKIEQFWLSYIDALIKENQFAEAKQALADGKKRGVNSEQLDPLNQQLMSAKNDALPSPTELNRLLEHYQNRRYGDAEKSAISLSKQFPHHNFSWKILGAVLKKTGRVSEAVFTGEKTVYIDPDDAEAHYNLGNTLLELGRLEEAEASYKQSIALQPDYAEVHYNLGKTLQELGRLKEAEASYRQAIALKPDYTEAHCNLGNTLKDLGRLEEAEASSRQAIALESDYAEAHSNLGIALKDLGRLEEAEASLRQAIALKPDFPNAHNNLGNALKNLGKLEEAEASYKQAIALKPDYAEAHRHLAIMKKFDKRDEQFLQMQALSLDESCSEEQHCHLSFGLAKASEDLGDFENSFKYYSEGNALRKKLLNYDISQDIELFKQLKTSYPRIEKNSLKNENFSNEPTPIFIVGMPRSGTTLVEQIISSHSQVTGAGELFFATQFGSSIARGLSEADTNALLNFRENYLAKLQILSNDSPMVTDKMPQNFRYLGLLAAAFPEAKIVHIKRNPAAVCWGNYKQYFLSKAIGYCYGLDDVVKYYALYENLMTFWAKPLTNRIYNLDYELLTINQEDETRKLIHYLGLDWEKRCLSPQDNTRDVATASNMQVREKVYQGSSQQWKKFKPFLNGALDYFDD